MFLYPHFAFKYSNYKDKNPTLRSNKLCYIYRILPFSHVNLGIMKMRKLYDEKVYGNLYMNDPPQPFMLD